MSLIDVLIIGAGASGIGAAIALRESGREVVVLEGGEQVDGIAALHLGIFHSSLPPFDARTAAGPS